MPWLSAVLVIEPRHVEALTDALMEAGALSVDVADAAAGTPEETPMFAEPGATSRDNWARNRVTALFPDGIDVPQAVRRALDAVALPTSTACAFETVAEQDWVRITQAQFVPQRISARLWIVPTWHEAPDPQAINIVLDPGLAFGTGTHPTTRLCLRWLERHLEPGDGVIDYGCGSGILAIAASKFGARDVRGVDIDDQALLAARGNAVQNQVDAAFVAAADELGGPARVVVANILANPLMVLAPLLARLTLSGGKVALSGILVEQAAEVRAAYEPWFDMHESESEDGWVLLWGVKR